MTRTHGRALRGYALNEYDCVMPYKDAVERRAYSRSWVANRRAGWFADKKCAHCGSTERLELDHIDPATKVTNAIWSWSAERREAELAKCQPLCHECHKAKTKIDKLNMRGGPIECGQLAKYNHYGCRCTPCRRAKSIANALYRPKRKS